MSSLLTQVVRRQTLMMVPRRHDSALIIAGPPKNILTKRVSGNRSTWIFLTSRVCVLLPGETLHSCTVLYCADALSDVHHDEFTEIQWFESRVDEEQEISSGEEMIRTTNKSIVFNQIESF